MRTFNIGRSRDNDIVFQYDMVSSRHAELCVDDTGKAMLTDFSTNGTMVNGHILHHSSCLLSPGDAVFLPGSNRLDWENIAFGGGPGYGSSFRGGVMNPGYGDAPYAQNGGYDRFAPNRGNGFYGGGSNGDFYNGNHSYNPQPQSRPYGGGNSSGQWIYNSSQGNNFVEKEMTFGKAIGSVFSHYATFSGRARRKEYWFFFLFMSIINMLLLGACVLFAHIDSGVAGLVFTLYGLFDLATVIPSLALSVRRLHDTDRSGAYLFLTLIPMVGAIILIVWYCQAGTHGDNSYGPDPKY